MQGPRGTEHIDARVDLLRQALEAGFVLARREATTRGAPLPPRALRPFLNFDRVNDRVLDRVIEALDADEDFRARLASRLGLADPGADGAGHDAAGHDAASHDGVGERSGPAGTAVGRAGGSEDPEVAAARLFLVRPEGWSPELDALVAVRAADLDAAAAGAAAESAESRLAAATAALEEARAELAEVTARLASVEGDLGAEQQRRRTAEADLDAERRRAADAEEDRARAVRDLGDARRLADRRLEALRVAQAAAPAPGVAPPGGAAGADAAPAEDPAELRRRVAAVEAAAAQADDAARDALRAVARAAAALTEGLGAALDAALDQVGGAARSGDDAGNGVGDGAGSTGSPAPPAATSTGDGPQKVTAAPVRRVRRTPVRLQRGVLEGTREATMQLLGLDRVVVLVDGWNVSMAGWRHLGGAEQRQTLVAALGDLAARTGADFRVVFDGEGAGGRPTVTAPLPVRVHFTNASEEADDVVLRMVLDVPDDQPVVVVSSDQRVRDGARRRGANVVGSDELLEALRH